MMQMLRELDSEGRDWLFMSVAHILMADRIYEKSEKEFFEQIMKPIFHREAEKTSVEINKILKGRPLPALQAVVVKSPEHIVFMLDVLASAVYANGKMTHSESVKFYEAGQCLGLTPTALSYRLTLEGEKFKIHRKLEIIRKKLVEELSTN